MRTPHHHAAAHHHHGVRSWFTGSNWVPELSSLGNVVILRCAKILATSVEELQKKFEKDSEGSSACSLLEFCCFNALDTATQNANFLKDKQFRHLSFEMMLAWEAPDSVALCFKKNHTERNNQGRKNDADAALLYSTLVPLLKYQTERTNQGRKNTEDTAVFYSTLIPLLVHQKITVGKEAFVRMAPAIPGVADVLNAHFLFDALSRPTGGRLPYRVYVKYLKELDKALDSFRERRDLLKNLYLNKGENVVEVDETMASAMVIQHIGASTLPGRLILTDYSLFFEPVGMTPYGAPQKWDLAADLQQVVEPCAVGPWTTPLFDRAIFCKCISNNEPVIFEFPEFLGCSRRDYWLMIIQEIIYTHQFIRKISLKGASQVEAVSRSIMGIIRLKAIKEALRANPAEPKLLLCFFMAHVSPCGYLVLQVLENKLKKGALLDSRGKASDRRVRYAKSATSVLCDSTTSYPKSKRNVDDTKFYVGDFFLDEMTHIKRTVEQYYPVWTDVNGSEIKLSGEKADNLNVNLAIIKVVLNSLRPTILWIKVLLSWDQPMKTISFILLGSLIIMRDLLRYVFSFFLLGVATFIIFFKRAGDGPLSGVVDILCPSHSTDREVLELQRALNGLKELLEMGNIILLRIHALLYSLRPKKTDQVILSLMILAGLVAIVPVKAMLLIIFWEVCTRQLPLRQENSEYYTRSLKEWWAHVPIAPVYHKDWEGAWGQHINK